MMALLSNCLCTDIVVILATFIIGVITYFKWTYTYWERKNVPYLKPSIPFGTMDNPLWAQNSFGDAAKIQYEESKRKGYKHVGLFSLWKPTYMPIDLEYIKDILSKDFHHFIDRGFYFNEEDDPISAHLFSLEGSRWKNLRMKLTPTFTSGKMKTMFKMLVECGKQLTDAMEENFNKHAPVDIKDVLARFGTDVIGTCAFGIDCNSFKNPNSEFRSFAKRIFIRTKWEILLAFFSFGFPSLASKLGVITTPKEASTFFTQLIKDTVEYREKNNAYRNDFLQLLIELKNNSSTKKDNVYQHLTLEEITAQAFLFFVAGFETSSTTMSFCLFELAQNQDVQEKLREEINSVLDQQKEITYDTIKEMKYMKQVIDEVLRKYPPLPMLNRKCVLDYNIPNTDLTIEKGTSVIIPLLGIQHDPEYFPEPEKFDPDRFSSENKKHIKPFSYMPFGEGPRLCIGMRFGLMETGVGLALLLQKFRFSLSEKTKLPLKMNPSSFFLTVLGDIWLNVDKV